MNDIYKVIVPNGMTVIPVRDGYAIVPDRADWLTLPAPYNDTNCKYVGIVEVRNPRDGSHDYMANHYIAYLDDPDYDQEYYDRVLDCICAIDPDFKKIRNDIVNPEYSDPHNQCIANMTNMDDWIKAPQIGLFVLDVTTASRYNPTMYPYGCAIIRG